MRLEPIAVKVARWVLRGRGDGNIALLPDKRFAAETSRFALSMNSIVLPSLSTAR